MSLCLFTGPRCPWGPVFGLDKARYEAEYCFFENLVNMVNAENMVNVVNIIKAQEEKMKVIYEFSKTR